MTLLRGPVPRFGLRNGVLGQRSGMKIWKETAIFIYSFCRIHELKRVARVL
jgi:hypothetical protein